MQTRAKKCNKVFLILFSHNLRLTQREFVSRLLHHVHIASNIFSVIGFVSIIVIGKFMRRDNTARAFITKQRYCRVSALLRAAKG